MIPVLETPRLRLRPWSLEDAPRMRELTNDPSIADQTFFPYPQPEGWAEERIRKDNELAEVGEVLSWAVTLKLGDIIGYIVLRVEKQHRKGALGYGTGCAFRGKGYAREAAAAVLEFAFSTLELHRVQAVVFSDNAPSIKLLEKLGMAREGLLRAYVFKNDKPEDVISYAILRTDQ